MGGSGGGIAYNAKILSPSANAGSISAVHEVLIEESVLGWKEFELEVIRDLADNVIIVCSIETSIRWECIPAIPSPSPAQTLTDANTR